MKNYKIVTSKSGRGQYYYKRRSFIRGPIKALTGKILGV